MFCFINLKNNKLKTLANLQHFCGLQFNNTAYLILLLGGAPALPESTKGAWAALLVVYLCVAAYSHIPIFEFFVKEWGDDMSAAFLSGVASATLMTIISCFFFFIMPVGIVTGKWVEPPNDFVWVWLAWFMFFSSTLVLYYYWEHKWKR